MHNNKGSILLEAVLIIPVSVLSLVFMFEFIRLGQMHIGMEQVAFIYVRERALGCSIREAKNKSLQFLDSFWGSLFPYPVHFDEPFRGKDRMGRVHVRYPQFAIFHVRHHFKHHLEVTKSCLFPG